MRPPSWLVLVRSLASRVTLRLTTQRMDHAKLLTPSHSPFMPAWCNGANTEWRTEAMKFNRWIALPVAGVAVLVIGVAAAHAATPSPGTGTGSNYAAAFVNKLAGSLHLSATPTPS